MHAVGANVAGQIVSVLAGGMILNLVPAASWVKEERTMTNLEIALLITGRECSASSP